MNAAGAHARNTSAHDKVMAADFLARLDPNAKKFTFQFFSDGASGYAEIFHGTLDEVWPKVQTLNTPRQRVGVFVTINETDFRGRRKENILRPRALFSDADGPEQINNCLSAIELCGATPSILVNSGRGLHCYYICPDIPLEQFSTSQKGLSDKLGTDKAIIDLPRVMRLPGTLHLKDPANPRQVRLYSTNCTVQNYQFSELVEKLGLSSDEPPPKNNVVPFKQSAITSEPSAAFADLPLDESLADGLEANIEEIRSAVSAIPPSAISSEQEWMKLARGLAFEAAVINKKQAKELEEILDAASRRAPGYDEEDNRRRFQRYMNEALNRENPITIGTVFQMALDHAWPGWSPPTVVASPTTVVSSAGSKVLFSNIPHRQWLYGVDLIRGEITVAASPGGGGKTSLALGMAISIATGKSILGERIWGTHELRSLYINAEDSGVEMRRRTWAFCLRHGIAEHELDRLYVAGTDDPRVKGLSFLRTLDRSSSGLDHAGFKRLEELVVLLRPDLVVIDPLIVLCGGGNINDNAAMSLVILELKRLAINFECAILIIHHTNKGGEPGKAEAVTGASAIVNLARRAIMPVTMTDDEAIKLKVWPSQRYGYFKVVNAKSNLAPRSDDTPWYLLNNVMLPNAEPPTYEHGDGVQAIERIQLPLLNNDVAPADEQIIRRAILDTVEKGKVIDGQVYPYSPNVTGASNKRTLLNDAMAAVKTATGRPWHEGDLKAAVNSTIKSLISEKWLVEGEAIKGARFRRGETLRVDWPRTGWSKDSAAASHKNKGPNGPAVAAED